MRSTAATLFVSLLALSLSVGAVSAQTVDGGRGSLPLQVPESYDGDSAVPLVVTLHGYTSSGAGIESYMQYGDLVDGYGFLLVSPDGTRESGGDNNRFWNASKACCNFMDSTVDDSAYVLAIINAVKSEYNVDPKRVYLIGHSNGGFMAYRAAYDHSNTIAAMVSLAGAASTVDRAAPANPVHVLQIHGTDDATIGYEGREIGGNAYPGAVATVERWAGYNGCAGEGTAGGTRDLESEITGAETTATRYVSACTAGGSSELWSIAGGSHVPSLSSTFNREVIGWLFAHPKP